MPVLFNSAGTQRNFGILGLLVSARPKCVAGFAASASAQSETIVPYRDLRQREGKIGLALTVNFQPLLLSEALILTAESSAARPQ